MKKYLYTAVCILIILSCVLFGMVVSVYKEKDNEGLTEGLAQTEEKSSGSTEAWSARSLKKGLTTVIAYDKQYKSYVSSIEEAKAAIREYGVRQREQYANPPVENIELQMEQNFEILAVNLGELEEETAKDILRAFTYMYERYPRLKGTLTDLSLGNFENARAGSIAVTQNTEFIINEEFGVYPFVVKYEIILNAARFMRREKLLSDCAYQVETGYWPKGADISSIVVHELGHHLLNVIAMEAFGLYNACYITEENAEAYSRFVTDSLSVNQTVAKEVLNQAYEIWKEKYHHTGAEEEFRGSISGYARGEQPDGGISYGETFAEAIADVYLNGENAADASRAIVAVVSGL